jgi:hypothetical protein
MDDFIYSLLNNDEVDIFKTYLENKPHEASGLILFDMYIVFCASAGNEWVHRTRSMQKPRFQPPLSCLVPVKDCTWVHTISWRGEND